MDILPIVSTSHSLETPSKKDLALETELSHLSKKDIALETAINNIDIATQASISKKDLALETAGITRKLTYTTLKEHLTATITERSMDENGDEIIREVPNYSVQEKAIEKILRITGDIKPDNSVTQTGVQINIGGKPEEVSILLEMLQGVKRELSELKTSGKQTGEIIDVEYKYGAEFGPVLDQS